MHVRPTGGEVWGGDGQVCWGQRGESSEKVSGPGVARVHVVGLGVGKGPAETSQVTRKDQEEVAAPGWDCLQSTYLVSVRPWLTMPVSQGKSETERKC